MLNMTTTEMTKILVDRLAIDASAQIKAVTPRVNKYGIAIGVEPSSIRTTIEKVYQTFLNGANFITKMALLTLFLEHKHYQDEEIGVREFIKDEVSESDYDDCEDLDEDLYEVLTDSIGSNYRIKNYITELVYKELTS